MAVDISGETLTAMSAFAGAGLTCAGFGFWLANQFSNLKNDVCARIDAHKMSFETKLEAHEKLDQGRFENQRDRMDRQDLAITRLEISITGKSVLRSPYEVGTPG